MEKGFFVAPGQKRINPVLIAATMLALAGCSHSSESAQFSMAPPPPAFDPMAQESYGPSPHIMAFTGQPIPFPSTITLSDPGMPGQDVDYYTQRAALSSEGEEKGCKIKHRIDRDALLAYQWGQNRVALRVKGINMESEGLESIKLEYKLKLQPHKTHKEKCLYNSNWQGTIGSAYNELFLREKDTVWQQLDDITDDVDDAFDKLF